MAKAKTDAVAEKDAGTESAEAKPRRTRRKTAPKKIAEEAAAQSGSKPDSGEKKSPAKSSAKTEPKADAKPEPKGDAKK